MAGGRIGTIFVELDLDPTRYLKGQRSLIREAKEASNNLERNFHNLGIKSDATFDLMRSRATLAYNAIKNDARTTFSDMMRAHQAYGIEMQRITMEQFQQEKNLNEQRKQMSRDSQAGWLSMMKGMLAYRVILSGITALETAVSGTFKFLATIETATLGIGAAFMTAGKYVDATTGKVLEGADALKAAQVDSKAIIEELKIANLNTIATLDQLITAYQQTLPVAMARGFNRQQVKDFTLAMIQAAGAIGLPFEQMGEETRSLLTGAINPRTSRIATVLGLRNEDIAVFKNDAQGLFNFLMDKLKAYQVAGFEAQTTWAGLWSNMKDMAFQYLGEGMRPLFDAIKDGLISISRSMVSVNEQTGKVTWNPEFLRSMKEFKDGLTEIIADVIRLGMLLDKVAGSYTAFRAWVYRREPRSGVLGTVDELIGRQSASLFGEYGNRKENLKAAIEANRYWEDRYKESEKRLMDMAQRQEGFRAAKLDPFSLTGYEAGAVSVTTEYGQVLWYIKEINKETTYRANKAKPDADALKKAEEERIRLLKLEMELMDKQRAAREEYDNQMRKAEEDATAALDKFTRKELVGEEKQLAAVDAEMAEVNGKLREMFNITAETITIDERYLKMLGQLLDEGEKRKAQITETNIQHRIATDDMLKDLDKLLRANQEAETGTERARKTPDEYEALRSHRDLVERSYQAAVQYGDAYHAIMMLNDGLAIHYQRMRDNIDAVSLWSEAWNYANESTQGYINQIGAVAMNMFRGMENAITDFVMTGKDNFRDFANSVISDLVRIAVQASITAPLARGLGLVWPGFGGATPEWGSYENPWDVVGGGKALGGPVAAGNAYMVGENGPEYFVPAVSGSILPNGGKGNVTVNVHNNTGQQVSAKSSSKFDMNGAIIDIVLDGINRNVHGLRTALGGA